MSTYGIELSGWADFGISPHEVRGLFVVSAWKNDLYILIWLFRQWFARSWGWDATWLKAICRIFFRGSVWLYALKLVCWMSPGRGFSQGSMIMDARHLLLSRWILFILYSVLGNLAWILGLWLEWDAIVPSQSWVVLICCVRRATKFAQALFMPNSITCGECSGSDW